MSNVSTDTQGDHPHLSHLLAREETRDLKDHRVVRSDMLPKYIRDTGMQVGLLIGMLNKVGIAGDQYFVNPFNSGSQVEVQVQFINQTPVTVRVIGEHCNQELVTMISLGIDGGISISQEGQGVRIIREVPLRNCQLLNVSFGTFIPADSRYFVQQADTMVAFEGQAARALLREWGQVILDEEVGERQRNVLQLLLDQQDLILRMDSAENAVVIQIHSAALGLTYEMSISPRRPDEVITYNYVDRLDTIDGFGAIPLDTFVQFYHFLLDSRRR